MTASLPDDVQQVFDRFVTTEYTTIDATAHPITWPVTPYYHPGAGAIDVTTGIGYPKKARDAQRNPHVSLLFSDPTGSRLESPPMVLVQGTAKIDESDLEANRRRYERESVEKLPATEGMHPPEFVRKLNLWYYARIYVYVRPERIWVWRGGDVSAEPEIHGAHMEEVRSGQSEEPEDGHPSPEGGAEAWDERMNELGDRYRTAVLAVVAPDGFPFSVRVPISVDRAAHRIRIGAEPAGVPLEPGLACLTAHAHDPDFGWQSNFQVRGDLIREAEGWALVPHRLVGGIELPPGRVAMLRENFSKIRRYRRVAKREMARRR